MHLQSYLKERCDSGGISAAEMGVMLALAAAAIAITALIRRDGIDADLGAETGDANSDGDTQKALDVRAEALILAHLKESDAAYLLSEEQPNPIALPRQTAPLIVAVDPLDGSSNIAVNVTVGTIFALMPWDGKSPRPCRGRDQLGAGFFTYGAQTTLILAFASDARPQCFVLDEAKGHFVALGAGVEIAATTNEYAINAAYAQHWHAPIQQWKTQVLADAYSMRWVGSLVADAWRIFRRGGVFLYPADARTGMEAGRLRLVYEANPIAFLVEKAGGLAVNGGENILDLTPQELHERTPLLFGSADEMKILIALHKELDA